MDTTYLPPDPDWRTLATDRHEATDDGPWYQQPPTVLVFNRPPVPLASAQDRENEAYCKQGRDEINEKLLNEMGL